MERMTSEAHEHPQYRVAVKFLVVYESHELLSDSVKSFPIFYLTLK